METRTEVQTNMAFRSLIAALFLLPSIVLAQPTVGASGWISAEYVTDTAYNGTTLTIDSGSNRVFVHVVQIAFANPLVVTTMTVGGQSATACDLQTQTVVERMNNYTCIWDESAISSMSGSDVAYDDDQADDIEVSYVTLTNVDQTGLSTWTYTGEAQGSAVASQDVTSTSASTDYLCVIAQIETAGSTFTGWDTLTEIWDSDVASGSHTGGACGTGGDSPTTVTPSASDDLIAASLVFSESSGPTLSGVTISAVADGWNLQGTLTGSGTLTAYGVVCEPGQSNSTAAQVVAGNCADATAALYTGSEVWTTAVQNDFSITSSGVLPNMKVCLAGSDGTDNSSVSCSTLNRSADTGQTLVTLSSAISSTSIFAVQTVSGCDTDGSTAIVTGCTSGETAWLSPGMIVDLSAGFADLTDVIVESVTDTTITFENASNSMQTNITVTQDTYYSPAVATNDVIEHDSNNSQSEAVTIGTDGEISFTPSTSEYRTFDYCIEDVSDTTGAAFTAPSHDCGTGEDTVYWNNSRPVWDDWGDAPLVLDYNTAMTTIILSSNCTDPDGEANTFSNRAGNTNAGVTIAAGGNVTGTPTVEDETGVTWDIICTDPGGLASAVDKVVYVVDTVTMPTLDDSTEAAADTDYANSFPWAAGLGIEMSKTVSCGSEAAGQVSSQSPSASTEVAYNASVSIVISSGPCSESIGTRNSGINVGNLPIGL